MRIGVSGWVRNVRCYESDAAPDVLRRAVAYATGASLFTPAMHDGSSVAVTAMLTVTVDTTLANPLILAVLNNGADSAKYGLLYSAPQRRGFFIFKGGWSPANLRAKTALIRMTLQIDEHGVVTDCSLSKKPGTPDVSVESVREATARMKFIPGSYDGKPAPMTYFEAIVWR